MRVTVRVCTFSTLRQMRLWPCLSTYHDVTTGPGSMNEHVLVHHTMVMLLRAGLTRARRPRRRRRQQQSKEGWLMSKGRLRLCQRRAQALTLTAQLAVSAGDRLEHKCCCVCVQGGQGGGCEEGQGGLPGGLV